VHAMAWLRICSYASAYKMWVESVDRINSVACVFNMLGQITHKSHCIIFLIADKGVVMSFLDILEQDLSHNFRCFRRYINLYGKRFQNKNCNMLQIFMYDQHNGQVFCYMLHIPFPYIFKKKHCWKMYYL
jgi:hypothetical protein